MNKLLQISFAFVLILSTVGITVDKHYCHGHYIGTWFYTQDDHCDMDMPMNSDWCHDDVTLYSLQSEFQVVPSTASPVPTLTDIVNLPMEMPQQLIEQRLIPNLAWRANPPPPEPNIYTKVQSFLL